MKVLLVKLSAFGDVVQSLPVACAIKDADPYGRLDWVVERPSSGLLLGHPALDNVLISPRHDIKEKKAHWSDMDRFARELRSVRYDAVVDLQGLMKSAIFVTLSRARMKLGFSGGKEPLAALALSRKLPPYDPERHAVDRYLDLLEPLGVERPRVLDYGLTPTSEELIRTDRLLRGLGGERPLVVLHPVALWETKLWPLRHWTGLVGKLLAMGLDLVITGAAADRQWGQAMVMASGNSPRVRDLTGKTGLRDLAALLGRADLVVCTDTGAMHLAAAVGTPVVALFGPTAPWRTGPYGNGHRVLRLGLDCSPCFRKSCPRPRCLDDLLPATVAGEVRAHLGLQHQP